jgi:outer membrane protein assembly factor BamB
VHDPRSARGTESFHGDPVIASELVLVGSDAEPVGHVYAFESETGRLRWRREFEGGVAQTLIVSGGTVYGVTVVGKAFALRLETGDLVWEFRPPDAARPAGDPLLDGGSLVFAAEAGSVYSLDLAKGTLRWQRDLDARLVTSVAAVAGSIFVGSTGAIHKLNAVGGATEATFSVTGVPFGTLTPLAGCLLALLAPDTVACLDVGSGSAVWERRLTEKLSTFRPALGRGLVVVGSVKGRLLALDAQGRPTWEARVPGVVRSIAWDAGGLYLGMQEGRIHAIAAPGG